MQIRSSEVECDSWGYKRPKSIDQHGSCACASKANSEEVPRVYSTTTRLAILTRISRSIYDLVKVRKD